ncbi:hypothetical protein [Micromonospora sp. NPDC004704]
MSINEVKATLRQGIQAIKHGQDTFERAASDATEATRRAMRLLHDSQNEHVDEVRDNLDDAQTEADRTLGRFAAAAEDAGTYLTKLG